MIENVYATRIEAQRIADLSRDLERIRVAKERGTDDTTRRVGRPGRRTGFFASLAARHA